MKKILIALFMVVFTLSFSVCAQVIESGECGDNLTWTLDDEGTLVISGTGDMWHYTLFDTAPWSASLKKVVLENGVTSIGNYAFAYCTNLTSITIPDSVTSIGVCVFSDCTNLTSITIPDSVTSIGYMAFDKCYYLTSITVDKENKLYSNDERGVLFNKDKTTLIHYPSGNTNTKYIIPDSVTSIGDSAFIGCTGLTSVTIPDSVTSISSFAFYDCTKLTSITIPDSVSSIGYCAFYYCIALETVYYQGTEEEWNRIVIGEENFDLLNANIIFNYAPQEEVTDETKLTESVEVPEEDFDETANATEESNKGDNSLMIVIVVCVTVIVCLCIVAAVVIFVVKSKNKGK